MKWKALFGVIFISAMLNAADSKLVAVKYGKLWNGHKVIEGALVVIEGDRIQSVAGGNPAPPAGAQVVDWSRYYGLPGLIDVHTHMTYYWDHKAGTRPLGQNRMPAVTVFLAQENARKTLEAGVTAVRDLGSQEFMDMAMRDLINRGAMVGPRMFVCGYGLSVPRTQRPGVPPVFSPGTADSPESVMKAVRTMVAAGADVIKMYGSVGSFDNVSTQQTFTYEEMRAAVEVAHTVGKKIAIHSYGPEGGRDAVRAGADSLEHAVDLDDPTLAQMVKQGTYYVPTIDHNRYYIDAGEEYQFAPGYDKNLKNYIQRNFETAKRAFQAGVKFAMGSDAVYTMFGQNTRELAWFVKVGMTPEQALQTATVNAAELLGKSDTLGEVAPHYFADMIAVEGDPLRDIDVAIHNIRGVMKGGKVYIPWKTSTDNSMN
jgi:imidazolonepropionase-like amidohydrolase